MATFPWLRYHENQGQKLEDYPHLKRWYDKLEARPAVQQGLAILKDDAKPMDDKAKALLFGETAVRETVNERSGLRLRPVTLLMNKSVTSLCPPCCSPRGRGILPLGIHGLEARATRLHSIVFPTQRARSAIGDSGRTGDNSHQQKHYYLFPLSS